MADLDIRITGRAGRITLTRDRALNALTHDMALVLHKALDDWRDDPAVDLVVIDAAGERAFCAPDHQPRHDRRTGVRHG